jgi:hypothetical protein
VLGLQGHSESAVASSSQIDGGFDAIHIGDTSASVSGKSSFEIGVSGTAAAQAAVDMAFGAALAPAGAARATSTISAAAQSKATVLPEAQVATRNAAIAQAGFTITGVISGTSQAPLFAQATSAVLIGGSAKLDAAVSGGAEAGNSLDLVGASDGGGAVSGAGVSAVDLALNFAGDTALPAAAGSAVPVTGDVSASVAQAVSTADVLLVAGTSSVGLPILATVEGEFTVEGYTAGFCGITISAQGEISVPRRLVTDVAIFADAARAVDLNGQGAARVASGVTSAIASITVSGTTTAAALALGDAATTMALSGKIKAKTSPASTLSGAFEVGLTASGTAPRQAAFGAVLAVGSSAGAITKVASAAFGDLATAWTATAAAELHGKASMAIAFTRDAAAVALIDATSARAIAFRLDALAQVDLAAGFIGQAPYFVAVRAAATSRAETADAVDLSGVASAQTDVQASTVPELKVAGSSASLATVGADSLGDFTIASAGEAEAAIIGVSARSLPLAGDAAANVQLLANVGGGTLDFGVTVAAAGNIHAVASRSISLAGLGRGNVSARAQADSVYVVTRAGAGDLAVVGQSARVVTLLGQASVATATMAAANTSLPVQATASSEVRLLSAVQQAPFGTSENSAAVINIDGSAQRTLWPVAGASIAFRAPPSQRRSAFVSAQQGGRVLSEPQGGGIIPTRITSAA